MCQTGRAVRVTAGLETALVYKISHMITGVNGEQASDNPRRMFAQCDENVFRISVVVFEWNAIEISDNLEAKPLHQAKPPNDSDTRSGEQLEAAITNTFVR